jgi:hypothetical protein
MRLFSLDNTYNVVIDPIAYSIEVFKKIWDRDKTKTKEIARKELSYIYFNNDFKSDFMQIIDRKERSNEVIKYLFAKEWSPDALILDAEEFYNKRQETISSKLLNGAMIYADKLRKFFEDVDLNERDDKNKHIFNAKQGNDVLKDLGKTIESLKQLEEIVRKEQESSGGMLRGGRKKGMYA